MIDTKPAGARQNERARRRIALAGLLAGTAIVPAGAARAQVAGGLVNPGYITPDVSPRDAVSSLINPPATVNLGRPWTVGGSVSVEGGATNNAGSSNDGWQPIFLLAPEIHLDGATSRLNVSLSYAPVLSYYPSTSNQTLLAHNFNGIATATIVPDWLYFTARGTTSLQSRFGGGYFYNNSVYSTSDAVQSSSFSVSPYLQHQFGGAGTLTLSYTYAATFQNADNLPIYAPLAAATAGYGSLDNLQTSTEAASFVTGENLGRIQDSISFSASQNGGSTFYDGSSTIFANNEVAYALYHWLSLLADVGYESYDYPSSRYHLDDITWALGFTAIPNADSSITVKYGRKAGIDTVLAQGSYSPTARTRIFASYDVGITTGIGSQQGLLAATIVGPGGILVDRVSGAPVIGNSYYGSQFTLSRVKSLTATGLLLLDRDSFSLTYARSEIQQLVNSQSVVGVITPAGLATSSDLVNLGWEHDLNPTNTLYSSISYTTTNNGAYFGSPGASQDTLQFYTNLTHIFTDTLSGNVSYSHAERFGNAVNNLPAVYGGNTSQDTILVGLRKTF